jgi:chloramphenicol-sensitive protein RarD
VAGLGVESMYLFLPALAFAIWAENGHGGAFFHGWGWRNDLLLIFGGAVTAVPLIGFAYGVKRIPLSLVGILQYIAPSLQLLLGVFFFHEAFDTAKAIGFAAIWAGLILFVGDNIRTMRAARAQGASVPSRRRDPTRFPKNGAPRGAVLLPSTARREMAVAGTRLQA